MATNPVRRSTTLLHGAITEDLARFVEDYIEFEDDYAMVKTRAPEEAVGMPLGQSRLRSKYGVTVVGVKRPGEGFTYATADTVVNSDDVLILAGRTAEVERVAELT